ncbi:MAG: hypothetical protein VX938_07045, partial [Myxococcota bacterium]|nr:hypothetical protein [Myxococcota bacterium]
MRTRGSWIWALGVCAAIAGGCSSGDPNGAGEADAINAPDTALAPGDDAVASPADVATPGDTSSVAAPDAVSDVGTPDDATGEDTVDPGCEEGGCFGQTCDDPSDCFSGICVPHLGDEVCSKACEAECPAGFSCDLLGLGGGDASFICVSKHPNLCQPCDDSGDCDATGVQSACVLYGDQGAFCGGSCDGDADCPDGFECQESETTSGGTTFQCVPSAGICECSETAIDLALWTICHVTNDAGTCHGTRLCLADGLSDCDAATPL